MPAHQSADMMRNDKSLIIIINAMIESGSARENTKPAMCAAIFASALLS